MEILKISDVDNSKLNIHTIKNIYKKWILFYNGVFFDVHFSEIIKDYKYCIINNNELLNNKLLLGLLNINKNENNIIYIDIIISNEIIYWYEIIRTIRIFCKDKEYVKLHFRYIYNDSVIKKIIRCFNGVSIGFSHILPLYKYNDTFNKNLNIEIILYDNSNKKSILLKHKTNILINKNFIKDKYPCFYMLNIFKNKYIYYKLNEKKHKFNSINIIFEKKIKLNRKYANNTSDIWIDIIINYNNQKIILKKNNYDFRLNKLNDNSINDYEVSYIYSIYSIKYDCKCKSCNRYEKTNNPYYFRNESSKILYDFIDKNFNEILLNDNYKFYDIDTNEINLDIDYDISLLFDNENNIKTECSYIYLIEKYDVNEKQTIFKFGKTNRNINERLKEHGREGKILLILDINDCSSIEKKILQILSNDDNIKKLKNIGNEYFYCENKSYIIDKIITNIN